jgi:four helix bundle protein
MNLESGCGCGTDAEFRRSLSHATESASQLDYQLLLAHDLGYLPEKEHAHLTADLIEVRRMLAGLTHTVNG